MDQNVLRGLLEAVAKGEESVDDALTSLRTLPFEDIGFATLDHHRSLRWGFPEVIYCEGKTPAQFGEIAHRLARRGPRMLGTRATPAHYVAARERVPELNYNPSSRCLWLDRATELPRHSGVVLVAAGTTDLPVLEEATITLDLMGHSPSRIYDVGVAGLHR